MAAILRRAVFDFVLYREPGHGMHNLAVDAAGWLFWDGEEPEDEEGCWSFRYICFSMNLDYRSVRQHCLRLTRADLKRVTFHLKEE